MFQEVYLPRVAEWKLEKDKNGIKIYTRTAEGSKYKEILAKTTFDVPINQVYNTLVDSEGFGEWYSDCIESKDIKRENTQSFTRYISLDIPWPFDNRDMVSDVNSTREGEVITIDLTNAPDDYPIQEDMVRIPEAKGYYKLTPNGNKTDIEYSYLADPGGLPAWVVNLFVVDGPYTSLTALKIR